MTLLRSLARKKGLNTAALAQAAKIDRARLKHVLAGTAPLTVDELVAISSALELSPEDLATIPALPTRTTAEIVGAVEHVAPAPEGYDPLGNHAEQALRMGFALGVDMFLVFDSSKLQESGVPEAVLSKFPDTLPIKLDAAYHRHNDPQYHADSVQLVLSFDALRTCRFTWDAFRQITFFPLPPNPPDDDTMDADDDDAPPPKSHLRLVE